MIDGKELRISTLSLFKKSILPKYEDSKNENGGDFSVMIQATDFVKLK